MPNMSTLPKDIANGITATRKQNMDWLKLVKAGMWCGNLLSETDEQIA